MKADDLHKLLKDNGFRVDRKDGPHIVYKHKVTNQTFPVPKHKEVSPGVIRKFNDLLKGFNNTPVTEQFRPIGFHSKASEGLKKHLRITRHIQKQRRNRIFYKNLHNRLDRK